MADRHEIFNRDCLCEALENLVDAANQILSIVENYVDPYDEYADINPIIKSEIITHKLADEIEELAEKFKTHFEKL